MDLIVQECRMSSTARASTETFIILHANLRSILSAPRPLLLSDSIPILDHGRQWLQHFPPLLAEMHQKDAMLGRLHKSQTIEVDEVISFLTRGMGETVCWLAEASRAESPWSDKDALEPLNDQIVLHIESLTLLREYLQK